MGANDLLQLKTILLLHIFGLISIIFSKNAIACNMMWELSSFCIKERGEPGSAWNKITCHLIYDISVGIHIINMCRYNQVNGRS